jgi:hypothetical protein
MSNPTCPHGVKVLSLAGDEWMCPTFNCPPEAVRTTVAPGAPAGAPSRCGSKKPPATTPTPPKGRGKAKPGFRPVVDSVEQAPDGGTLVKVPRGVCLDYVAWCVTNKTMTARDLHLAHLLTNGGFAYATGRQTDYRTASWLARSAGMSSDTGAEDFFKRAYVAGALRKVDGTGKRLRADGPGGGETFLHWLTKPAWAFRSAVVE